MTDGTIVISVSKEDLDATGRVILEAGRWCKTFYADGPWRPRGKWVKEDLIWEGIFVCDQCGERTVQLNKKVPLHNFCPNCGADMREEAQDERSD